jgi:large subunit ribosomal protein L30
VSKLVIRQYKSAIGEKLSARETLASLGLRRPGNMVEREDSPSLRGQLRKINHLVHIDETAKEPAPKAPAKEQALKEQALKEPVTSEEKSSS